MFKPLTQQAREVITLAAGESRRLRHEYIGTEHILLALSLEPSFARSGVLARLGLNADAVRARVEELVRPGPPQQQQTSGAPAELPLTPRAARAVQMASDEAASVSLPLAGPEHLLIGLIRESDGVAGRVMRELGLDEGRVRGECLLGRLRQMQIVERCVRPVRANVKRKRRMREELLAHLAAICEEEQQAKPIDAPAALDAAARRFGDPAELARELQASVPRSERIDCQIEYWLGWRAPETVLRMLLRTSFISFCLLAAVAVVAILAGVLFSHDSRNDIGVVLRVFLSMMFLCPAGQFGFGWCYFKARDALWGAFGHNRSRGRALAWLIGTAVVVLSCGLGFVFIVEGSSARVIQSLPSISAGALGAAIACGLLARFRGLVEIRDAMWGLLPVDTVA
jgi:ATP-dependent Clp protease ATP-binding subunit ClpC